MNEEKIIVEVDAELQDMVIPFLERTKNYVQQILNGDFAKAVVLGHQLKGAGGGYGLDRISELGALIEKAGKDNDSLAIKKHGEALQHFLNNLQLIFK